MCLSANVLIIELVYCLVCLTSQLFAISQLFLKSLINHWQRSGTVKGCTMQKTRERERGERREREREREREAGGLLL